VVAPVPDPVPVLGAAVAGSAQEENSHKAADLPPTHAGGGAAQLDNRLATFLATFQTADKQLIACLSKREGTLPLYVRSLPVGGNAAHVPPALPNHSVRCDFSRFAVSRSFLTSVFRISTNGNEQKDAQPRNLEDSAFWCLLAAQTSDQKRLAHAAGLHISDAPPALNGVQDVRNYVARAVEHWELDENVLQRERDQYVAWVKQRRAPAGPIELSILSILFGVELEVLDSRCFDRFYGRPLAPLKALAAPGCLSLCMAAKDVPETVPPARKRVYLWDDGQQYHLLGLCPLQVPNDQKVAPVTHVLDSKMVDLDEIRKLFVQCVTAGPFTSPQQPAAAAPSTPPPPVSARMKRDRASSHMHLPQTEEVTVMLPCLSLSFF
jgi:hypothetical protein